MSLPLPRPSAPALRPSLDGGPDGDLWGAVLGPAEPGVAALCDGAGFEGIQDCPAVTLADQEKAFERISYEWLAAVFSGWRMPTWLARGLLDQVARRVARSGIGGRLGVPRALLRGIGMGGGHGQWPHLERWLRPGLHGGRVRHRR